MPLPFYKALAESQCTLSVPTQEHDQSFSHDDTHNCHTSTTRIGRVVVQPCTSTTRTSRATLYKHDHNRSCVMQHYTSMARTARVSCNPTRDWSYGRAIDDDVYECEQVRWRASGSDGNSDNIRERESSGGDGISKWEARKERREMRREKKEKESEKWGGRIRLYIILYY